jgi:hypothetical protein
VVAVGGVKVPESRVGSNDVNIEVRKMFIALYGSIRLAQKDWDCWADPIFHEHLTQLN